MSWWTLAHGTRYWTGPISPPWWCRTPECRRSCAMPYWRGPISPCGPRTTPAGWYAHTLLTSGNWGDKGEAHNLGVNLAGKRALLLGFGTIGRSLAPILSSLGMEVTASARSGREVDGVAVVGPDAWRSQLGAADVLV